MTPSSPAEAYTATYSTLSSTTSAPTNKDTTSYRYAFTSSLEFASNNSRALDPWQGVSLTLRCVGFYKGCIDQDGTEVQSCEGLALSHY